MRKMKSLIKQQGGWNNFKKYVKAGVSENMTSSFFDFFYNNYGIDKLIDALRGVVSKQEQAKLAGSSDMEIMKICESVANDLHEIIDSACLFAYNNKDSYDAIFLFPQCVIESFIDNAIFLYALYSVTYKKNLSESYKELVKIKFDDERALKIDSMLVTLGSFNIFFSFAYTPEGFWWNDFYRYGFCTSSRECDIQKSHDFAFYKDYIKAHPECKEEIKEFCKQ